MIFLNTFPRSGHHFLVNTLGYYFPKLSYCEKYTCLDENNEPIQCMGKGLPNSLKLVCRAGKRIQKSHDFDLDEPILSGKNTKYLILVRHPLPAIISHIKLVQVQNQNALNTRQEVETFFLEQLTYYVGFCRKYLISNKATPVSQNEESNIRYTTYEDITSSIDELINTLKFISPKQVHSNLDVNRSTIEKLMHPNSKFEYELLDKDFCLKHLAMHDLSFIKRSNGDPLITM